jgi:hypothetical protein
MGPWPNLIGYIIDECTIIHAGCLEDILSSLPVTISGAIYDDYYSYSHDTCEVCQEILDPDVDECENEDCYHCGHRPAIEEAIEILEQAQMELIADHGTYDNDNVSRCIEFDTHDHQLADETLDNAQDHLRELL